MSPPGWSCFQCSVLPQYFFSFTYSIFLLFPYFTKRFLFLGMDNDSVVSNCNFCNPHILFVGCLGRLKKSDGSDQRKLSWKKDWKFYRKEGTWGKGSGETACDLKKFKNTEQIRTFDVLIMVNMTAANELYSECVVFFLWQF